MIETTRLGQKVRLPDGYINLAEFGYGGVYTDYFANAEGKVISVYHGKTIRAKYQRVIVHKRDNVKLVRLQRLDQPSCGFPVLITAIKSLVTTGKASTRGKRITNISNNNKDKK